MHTKWKDAFNILAFIGVVLQFYAVYKTESEVSIQEQKTWGNNSEKTRIVKPLTYFVTCGIS